MSYNHKLTVAYYSSYSSFIHSFSEQVILSSCHMPSIILDSWTIGMNKKLLFSWEKKTSMYNSLDS